MLGAVFIGTVVPLAAFAGLFLASTVINIQEKNIPTFSYSGLMTAGLLYVSYLMITCGQEFFKEESFAKQQLQALQEFLNQATQSGEVETE